MNKQLGHHILTANFLHDIFSSNIQLKSAQVCLHHFLVPFAIVLLLFLFFHCHFLALDPFLAKYFHSTLT